MRLKNMSKKQRLVISVALALGTIFPSLGGVVHAEESSQYKDVVADETTGEKTAIIISMPAGQRLATPPSTTASLSIAAPSGMYSAARRKEAAQKRLTRTRAGRTMLP